MTDPEQAERSARRAGITLVVGALVTALAGVGAFFAGHARGVARAEVLAAAAISEIIEDHVREMEAAARSRAAWHDTLPVEIRRCRAQLNGDSEPPHRRRRRVGDAADPGDPLEGLEF